MYRDLKQKQLIDVQEPTGDFETYPVISGNSYDMVSIPRAYEVNVISDMFSETARVRASIMNKDSPYNHFFSVKGARHVAKRVIDGAKRNGFKYGIDTFGLREAAWCRRGLTFSECTQFKPTIARKVCELFSSIRVLNPCGGWGCRALGCASVDTVTTIVDIDPNPNLIEPYSKIKDFINTHEPDTTLIQHHFPFEEYSVDQAITDFNGYLPDLIFTSPPFGFYEIYNKEDDGQSTSSLSTHNDWIDEWFIPFLEQCWQTLADDGYLALYVGDAGGYIVQPMIDYMNECHRQLWTTIGCRNTRQSYAAIGIYVWRKD